MIPYLTAGIGYGKNKLSSFSNTSNNTNSTITQSGKTINNLIWNAGAGMTIAFINDSRFTIRYSI
jgi:opacity protein-like surface antigen